MKSLSHYKKERGYVCMKEDRKLIVGFDLCNDYSQISCYNDKTFEPDSVCEGNIEGKYLIPTVLGVKEDTKDWYFGSQAVELFQNGKGLLIGNLIENMVQGNEIKIYGTSFSTDELLEKFLRKSLSMIKAKYPNETIKKIVITVKQTNERLIEGIYKALEPLGLLKDRVSIQSHSGSYMYFALSQKKELWMNDIGLFDFDRDGLHYYQIKINRKNSPVIVAVAHKDFSDTLSYEMLQSNEDNLGYIFENLAKNVLHKQIVSTLYITGIGFEGTWVNDVLKELCVGRRVFMGQNLYTKGACYLAKTIEDTERFKNFLFISEEMITSAIGMKLYYNAQVRETMLIQEGTPWHDGKKTIDVILDDEQEIAITVKDILKKSFKEQIISLEGLPERPNKMTRIRIRLELLDVKSLAVTVKDLGFGEFYSSSNRIWEKVIEL